MREFARDLYQSKAWKAVRDAYMASKHGLCERCHNAAQIVHHRKHLTPNNIKDINITLNWNNLECLCRECHAQEHEGVSPCEDGLRFDESGNVVRIAQKRRA